MKCVHLNVLVVAFIAAACGSQTTPATDDGFVQIFDGKTLDGWSGDTVLWRVENGHLVGEITPDNLLKKNSFIVWTEGEPSDFELKAEVRITETGNSGINYRSVRFTEIPNALRGYQADIDGRNNYTGQNYEERGRTTLAYQGEHAVVTSQPNPDEEGSLRANITKNMWLTRETNRFATQDSLRTLIKTGDWNEIHIIAKGNRLQHYVNGTLLSDVIDNDEINRKMSGLLGVQVHVGPPMKVEYRNIKLKE